MAVRFHFGLFLKLLPGRATFHKMHVYAVLHLCGCSRNLKGPRCSPLKIERDFCTAPLMTLGKRAFCLVWSLKRNLLQAE